MQAIINGRTEKNRIDMMKLKTKKIISLCGIFVLALVGVICFSIFNKKEDRLSKADVAKLRDKYPVCSVSNAGALASMTVLTLDEVMEDCDTVVYGEVIGDYVKYSNEVSTGIEALDEKAKEIGMSNEEDFYNLTISVIKDTEGIYQEGEQLTLPINAGLINCHPKFSDGMKVVMPMTKGEDGIGYYFVDGTYYVTDDGYALSCTEDRLEGESKSKFSMAFSGVKLDDLLEDLSSRKHK